MKILINDHSGHGFTLSLSKELAKQHVVFHCFSKNFQSPKGFMEKLSTDPSNLFFFPLIYKKEFSKYSLVKRAMQERTYAAMLNKVIDEQRPDIVICANTPLVAQQKILSFCKKKNIPFLLWFQDIYSLAIKKIALKKLGLIGHLVAAPFEYLEKYQLKNSNCIVSITEDFSSQFKEWDIKTSNFVIPNWSPIDEIKLVDKTNEFSKKLDLERSFNIVYSGTMGFKHNPQLIIELSRRLTQYDDIKIVVVSEGLGASYLEKQKQEMQLSNLLIIPFQPFEKFSQVLSTADVFLAMLEDDAGVYSVPSKVLSYLCAGKPTIVAAPANNLASKIVRLGNSGKCIENNNVDQLLSAVLEIKHDSGLYHTLSKNARSYAEQNFRIEKISESFTDIIQKTIQ
jgi:glycosyltransferase involved in cell wall biosynthesis